MKKSLLLLAVLIVALLANSCTEEKTIISPPREFQSDLQKLVDAEMAKVKAQKPNMLGGMALFVLTPDAQVFVSSGIPSATKDIHFRAASNTKTLTAAAILLLHERGQLKITDKITDKIPGTNTSYVPDDEAWAIPFKSEITILQLLQHRAGVFDITNNAVPDTVSADVPYKGKSFLVYYLEQDESRTFTFDELVGAVARCGIYHYRPGEAYKYSNTGYSILGKIIERISGKSYSQFIMDEIITPMGMTNSSMPSVGTDQSIPATFATGYYFTGSESLDATLSNMSGNVAEGNLITTPSDLAKFLRTLLRGDGVLSATTISSIMTNCIPQNDYSNTAYGCGLGLINNLGYGHSGAHAGYLSQMVYVPNADICIVIFTNVWDYSNGMTSLMKQVQNFEPILTKAKNIVCYGEK